MLCGWRVAGSKAASKPASQHARQQASPLGTKVCHGVECNQHRAQELAQVHHMVLNAIINQCRPCIQAADKISACSCAGKQCNLSGGGPPAAGGAPPSDGSDAVTLCIHRTSQMMSSLGVVLLLLRCCVLQRRTCTPVVPFSKKRLSLMPVMSSSVSGLAPVRRMRQPKRSIVCLLDTTAGHAKT